MVVAGNDIVALPIEMSRALIEAKQYVYLIEINIVLICYS